MSDPKKHLLRKADRPDQNDLSGLTGLTRLTLTEQVLSAGESLNLAPGREQFLYVLSGAGELRSRDQLAGTGDPETATASLHSGDFVALTASEDAVIHAETPSLTILVGRGPVTALR